MIVGMHLCMCGRCWALTVLVVVWQDVAIASFTMPNGDLAVIPGSLVQAVEVSARHVSR